MYTDIIYILVYCGILLILWWLMFADCQNVAGSWRRCFVGIWFRNVVLYCKKIHYVVNSSWGRKFMGSDNPRNPRTLNPHEQWWFHSISFESSFISYDNETFVVWGFVLTWLDRENFVKVERPSDKWGNSISRISWVTHGNIEEECHGSASGWLIPYHFTLDNVLI